MSDADVFRLGRLAGMLEVLAWHEMLPEPGYLWSEYRATFRPRPADPADAIRRIWPKWAEGLENPDSEWFITPLADWEASFRQSLLYWTFRRQHRLTFSPQGAHRDGYLDRIRAGLPKLDPVPIVLPQPDPLPEREQRHRDRLISLVIGAVREVVTPVEVWHSIQAGYKIAQEVYGFIEADRMLLVVFEATE